MIVLYCVAYSMDLLFGDPYSFPHPVRFIGRLITLLEQAGKRWRHKKLYGFLLCGTVVLSAYLVTLAIASLSPVCEVILIYTVFASRSLADEAMRIYREIKAGNSEKAAFYLGFIVSRATKGLPEREIIRGTVESVSENITDGIIAPLFYLLIGGVPLAMAYKAASTLDSMIGYKNERYRDLGFASAKLDDLLNWLPARLAGFLIIPSAALLCGKNGLGSLRVVARDRYHHESPNSAHSEAAVAGALGVRLGGDSIYEGRVEHKEFIGEMKRDFVPEDIPASVMIAYLSSGIGFLLLLCRVWFLS